jgi:hypothetical protein
MPHRASPLLRSLTIDKLAIGDEASFRHVALYADLKQVLQRARYPFRVLPPRQAARADRALLLNLTFWSADLGGDVLATPRIEADVVAHAAWHHLAAKALPASRAQKPSAAALFLGEAIASAFDVYLVGRLLGRAPRSTFLSTQTPAMADAAAGAGMSRSGFASLLRNLAADPEGAFDALRALLFDASMALYGCGNAEQGLSAIAAFDDQPLAALLPRYELSNWVLYARAYASDAPDTRVRHIERALRKNGGALAWLQEHWVDAALGRQ